jgi:hypothetical protein
MHAERAARRDLSVFAILLFFRQPGFGHAEIASHHRRAEHQRAFSETLAKIFCTFSNLMGLTMW